MEKINEKDLMSFETFDNLTEEEIVSLSRMRQPVLSMGGKTIYSLASALRKYKPELYDKYSLMFNKDIPVELSLSAYKNSSSNVNNKNSVSLEDDETRQRKHGSAN